MSFQQSINNAMSSAVNIKGIQALEDRTKIEAQEAKNKRDLATAQDAIQTVVDLHEQDILSTKKQAAYDKATDYYVGKVFDAGAEPSLVGHEIHQAAMDAAHKGKWTQTYDMSKADEAREHAAKQKEARDKQKAQYNELLDRVTGVNNNGKNR